MELTFLIATMEGYQGKICRGGRRRLKDDTNAGQEAERGACLVFGYICGLPVYNCVSYFNRGTTIPNAGDQ